MHDWTLVSLMMNWLEGVVILTFRNKNSEEVFLTAKEVLDIKVPKHEEWGKSASVNEVEGPSILENGELYISIEMQSGDKIELKAMSICMPDIG